MTHKFKVGDLVINTEKNNALREVVELFPDGYKMKVLTRELVHVRGGFLTPNFNYAHRYYKLAEETIIDRLLEKYK